MDGCVIIRRAASILNGCAHADELLAIPPPVPPPLPPPLLPRLEDALELLLEEEEEELLLLLEEEGFEEEEDPVEGHAPRVSP